MKFSSHYKPLLFALAILFALAGCRGGNTDNTNTGPYATGVFIVNEGGYTYGNAAISYIERLSKSPELDVFLNVNARPLGDVAQSMNVGNSSFYIVVNNSNKVEVVDRYSFASQKTITGFTFPRYFIGINSGKGYVTEWLGYDVDYNPAGPGKVAIINLANNTISGTITVGKWPEQLILTNNMVYVANSFDNTVSVINPNTDQVVTTITVSQGPNSFAVDNNGALWVLCAGKKDYVTPANTIGGNLVQINTTTNTVVKTIPINPVTNDAIKQLVANPEGTVLYFVIENVGLYQYNASAGAVAPAKIYANDHIYGAGYDPTSRYIYMGIKGAPLEFENQGYVIRFNNQSLRISDSFYVNIAPNSFFFN